MREVILAIGCEAIAPLLHMTFAPCSVAVRFVPDESLSLALGALADGAVGARGSALGEPMLVFCGISDARMDQLLAAMRRTGLRIPCKAVLTARNRGWTPARLLTELQRERAALGEN